MRTTAANLADRNCTLLLMIVPLLVIAALMVAFYLVNDRFLSTPNLLNLLRQSAVLLIVATGMTFVILIGAIDLSVGALVTFSAIVTAVLLRDYGTPTWLAVLAGAGLGLVVGLCNGTLIVIGRIPSFVATLGTMTIITGMSVWVSGGRNIIFRDEGMHWISSGNLISGLPNVALWAFLIYGIAAFVGGRTHLGRAITATGSAPIATLLSGFNTVRIKVIVFMISGLAAGLGGVMMVARTSSGTTRMGDDLLLDGIAAVVIGGTALSGGSGGVYRTIFGVAIIAIVKNGLNIAQVHPYTQTVLTGLLVIVAVALTLDRSRLAFVK